MPCYSAKLSLNRQKPGWSLWRKSSQTVYKIFQACLTESCLSSMFSVQVYQRSGEFGRVERVVWLQKVLPQIHIAVESGFQDSRLQMISMKTEAPLRLEG